MLGQGLAYLDGEISRRENGVNHFQDNLLDEGLLQTAVVRAPDTTCVNASYEQEDIRGLGYTPRPKAQICRLWLLTACR